METGWIVRSLYPKRNGKQSKHKVPKRCARACVVSVCVCMYGVLCETVSSVCLQQKEKKGNAAIRCKEDKAFPTDKARVPAAAVAVA